MQTNDMNRVLLGHLDQFLNISVINAEFTFRTPSDHLISFTSAELRVYPHENFLVPQLILEPLQCLNSTNVQEHTLFQGVVDLFLGDKVFSVKNLVRLVANLQSLKHFPRGDHINVCNSLCSQDVQNMAVVIGLHGVGDVEAFGGFGEGFGLSPHDLSVIDVERGSILLKQVSSLD